MPHPFPIFKVLNAYQWLLYIPLHNLRHDQQIAEVKRTPGYPPDARQPASRQTAPPESAAAEARFGVQHSGPSAQVLSAGGLSAEAQESFRKQMRELQDQLDQFRHRAKAAHDGISALKAEMGAQGLGLRSDVLEAESRANSLLENAQQAIATGDAVSAEHQLELTEYAIARIENFFGR